MGVIHIENVDEKVMQSLKLRARISGRSLEDEIRVLLAEAAKPQMSLEQFAEEVRQIHAMTKGWSPESDSVAVIREKHDVETSEQLSPEERVAVFRRAQAMTPEVPQTDSTDIIRELRDRGYAGR